MHFLRVHFLHVHIYTKPRAIGHMTIWKWCAEEWSSSGKDGYITPETYWIRISILKNIMGNNIPLICSLNDLYLLKICFYAPNLSKCCYFYHIRFICDTHDRTYMNTYYDLVRAHSHLLVPGTFKLCFTNL